MSTAETINDINQEWNFPEMGRNEQPHGKYAEICEMEWQ
jgi:hypothetical protein